MSGSGAQLPGTAPGWEALARSAAVPSEPCEERAIRRLLLVALDEDLYALPVERVREIVRRRPITPIPCVPAPVRGVITLRGDVLQVLHMRTCLGVPGAASAREDRRSRIVVLRDEEGPRAALQVDRVMEVWEVEEGALQAPPTGGPPAVTALCTRGDRFVSVVDVERILESIHGP